MEEETEIVGLSFTLEPKALLYIWKLMCVSSLTGGVAPSGSILQKPSAVLPVHCTTPPQQWWARLQQGEGDGHKVRWPKK